MFEVPLTPEDIQTRLVIQAVKEQITERDAEWLNSTLAECPPGTTLTWWRDETQDTSIHLRITRSMRTGSLSKNGVWHASKTIILDVKESYNLPMTAVESYASAQVITAARDMLLSVTTTWDMVVEEYCMLLEERANVIVNHSPGKCTGLRRHTVINSDCLDCKDQYKDGQYGRKLRDRMIALEITYGGMTERKADTGFNAAVNVEVQANQYDPSLDNFLQMAEQNAGRLIR